MANVPLNSPYHFSVIPEWSPEDFAKLFFQHHKMSKNLFFNYQNYFGLEKLMKLAFMPTYIPKCKKEEETRADLLVVQKLTNKLNRTREIIMSNDTILQSYRGGSYQVLSQDK